jgi:hypothetical protein
VPKISEINEYLSPEHVNDGEIITIIAKPTLISKEESSFGRAYFRFQVQSKSGEVKAWIPNRTTLKKLATKFGDETNVWLNKKVKLTKATINVHGETKQVLFGEPTQ